MSDEQINHRIAELCGWTEIRNSVYRHHKPWGHPPLNRDRIKLLPDYCTDLNAMHEAEKALTKAQWEDFVDHLVNDWISLPDPWKEVCHATAKEKAKAFLKTFGKWDDQFGDATEMVKEVQK